MAIVEDLEISALAELYRHGYQKIKDGGFARWVKSERGLQFSATVDAVNGRVWVQLSALRKDGVGNMQKEILFYRGALTVPEAEQKLVEVFFIPSSMPDE